LRGNRLESASGRTCAKLWRAAGGELEQIQMLLEYASIQTTERYLGTKQDLVSGPTRSRKTKIDTVQMWRRIFANCLTHGWF
jgi:hypothetical protein